MSDTPSKDLSDMFKMLFEFFKHLTTLSSGSILVILALAEKFIKQLADVTSLFGSMFCFSVVIVTSLVSMAVLAVHAAGDKPSKGAIKLFAWGAGMSGIGFFGGMMILAMVVLRALG
jgi:hypothetical protein